MILMTFYLWEPFKALPVTLHHIKNKMEHFYWNLDPSIEQNVPSRCRITRDYSTRCTRHSSVGCVFRPCRCKRAFHHNSTRTSATISVRISGGGAAGGRCTLLTLPWPPPFDEMNQKKTKQNTWFTSAHFVYMQFALQPPCNFLWHNEHLSINDCIIQTFLLNPNLER